MEQDLLQKKKTLDVFQSQSSEFLLKNEKMKNELIL